MAAVVKPTLPSKIHNNDSPKIEADPLRGEAPHEAAVQTGKAPFCQLDAASNTQGGKASLARAKNGGCAAAVLHKLADYDALALTLGTGVHTSGFNVRDRR